MNICYYSFFMMIATLTWIRQNFKIVLSAFLWSIRMLNHLQHDFDHLSFFFRELYSFQYLFFGLAINFFLKFKFCDCLYILDIIFLPRVHPEFFFLLLCMLCIQSAESFLLSLQHFHFNNTRKICVNMGF